MYPKDVQEQETVLLYEIVQYLKHDAGLIRHIAGEVGAFIHYLGLDPINFSNIIARFNTGTIDADSLFTHIITRLIEENPGGANIPNLCSILKELSFVHLSGKNKSLISSEHHFLISPFSHL